MSPLTQGAALTSEPFPSLIFSFTSGEVCLMTWVKTADTPAQGGRHCSVFHSNSPAQFWCQHIAALMVPFWSKLTFRFVPRLMPLLSFWKHTKQKTLVWLHIWLTFALFFFTGEAKSTALFFEPSSPSESTLASVGNSNHSLDTLL